MQKKWKTNKVRWIKTLDAAMSNEKQKIETKSCRKKVEKNQMKDG